MRLPLERLDGERVAGLVLRVDEQAAERSPHPVAITAKPSKGNAWMLFHGRTNPGTPWRHPWLETRFDPRIGGVGDGEALAWEDQVALFEALGGALVPGAYVMLSCDGHPDSLRALSVDVPPPCTALGFLLWKAGARWYKVWYYPEGWREGNEKVQGNLPVGDEHEAKRTHQRLEEIAAFLESSLAETFPACAQRGRQLLREEDHEP